MGRSLVRCQPELATWPTLAKGLEMMWRPC